MLKLGMRTNFYQLHEDSWRDRHHQFMFRFPWYEHTPFIPYNLTMHGFIIDLLDHLVPWESILKLIIIDY